MIMIATVLQVNPQSLLVRNEINGEEVIVNTPNASQFSVGDRVQIIYSGQMTLSIPPQITAISIQRIGQLPPTATNEIRAEILQRGQNFLIVRNIQNRQQLRVEYSHAHHFCVRQQVIIRYDTITLTNPPRITATDIRPICQ